MPVAYWKLDECSGNVAHDEIGQTNNGTIIVGSGGTQSTLGTCASSSAASAWYNGRSGKRNSSLSFDGVDDYVNMGEPSVLDFNGDVDMTVSAWVYINWANGMYKPIVGKGNSQWLLQTTPSDLFEFCVYDTWWRCGRSNQIIQSNTWYHVLAQKNGSEVSLWLNGVRQSYTDTAGFIADSAFDVEIGRNSEDVGRYLEGQIDEVKIWNYALTAEQVKTEYNGGAVKFGN